MFDHHVLDMVELGVENFTSMFDIKVNIKHAPFEPSHEIIVLFILCKVFFQMHMCSHPVGLDVWFLVGCFIYFHTLYVRTAKALARLRGCAGSPEPSLVAYVVSSIISLDGSFTYPQDT